MKNSQNILGASLVEVMVAFSLTAITAITIMPIMIIARGQSKFASVKQACNKAVQSKIDQYRAGRTVNYATEVSTTWPGVRTLNLQELSLPTFSATNSTVGLSGFYYAKLRYNQYFPNICEGASQAHLFVLGSPPQFGPPRPTVDPMQEYLFGPGGTNTWRTGLQECLGSSQILTGHTQNQAAVCTSPADQAINAQIPGFKLYVKIQLDTSWAKPIPAIANGNRLSPFCPDTGGGWNRTATEFPDPAQPVPIVYDFNGYNDGIRVTVTGVMDYPSVGAADNTVVGRIRDLGGVRDPGRMICSATTVLSPGMRTARFYLDRSGGFYEITGGGRNPTTMVRDPEMRRVLQSIQNGEGSAVSSFAVHPRNLSVYVLKPGSLMRYGSCGGYPLDCNLIGGASPAVDESGISSGAVTQSKEWTILNSVRHIAVDFKNLRADGSPTVYGMTGDRKNIYQFECLYGGAACTVLRPVLNPAAGVNPPDVRIFEALVAEVAPGQPLVPNRLTGFFMSPEGDVAYISDQSRSSLFDSNYNSSIYRADPVRLNASALPAAWGPPMMFPIMTLPVQAASFSM